MTVRGKLRQFGSFLICSWESNPHTRREREREGLTGGLKAKPENNFRDNHKESVMEARAVLPPQSRGLSHYF